MIPLAVARGGHVVVLHCGPLQIYARDMFYKQSQQYTSPTRYPMNVQALISNSIKSHSMLSVCSARCRAFNCSHLQVSLETATALVPATIQD